MVELTITSSIATSVICVIIILSLACGARAVLFSTKLPRPFRQLCIVCLATDIILVLITGIQPWTYWTIYYNREYVGTSSVLASLSIMLVSMERVFALKFPLRYIRCTGEDRFTTHLVTWAFTIIIGSYLFIRFLVCYMVKYTFEIHLCMSYQVYAILSIEGLIFSTTTICFGLVFYTVAKNKRQHIRRITRMGLPQNHALNAADTHVSATLFVLYPFALCITIFSVLLNYWPFIPDDDVTYWLPLTTRMVYCSVHGVLFNCWFDEWRLHFLTILSPLSSNLRDMADIMRINVYNIVVAGAAGADTFDGSRLQLEGSITSCKAARSRISSSSKISTVSATESLSVMSLSLKSPRTSTQEQQNRTKVTRLESITEAEV